MPAASISLALHVGPMPTGYRAIVDRYAGMAAQMPPAAEPAANRRHLPAELDGLLLQGGVRVRRRRPSVVVAMAGGAEGELTFCAREQAQLDPRIPPSRRHDPESAGLPWNLAEEAFGAFRGAAGSSTSASTGLIAGSSISSVPLDSQWHHAVVPPAVTPPCRAGPHHQLHVLVPLLDIVHADHLIEGLEARIEADATQGQAYRTGRVRRWDGTVDDRDAGARQEEPLLLPGDVLRPPNVAAYVFD
mmetsp:Transcript_48349/g.89647  ORF Transcript_48349/g.89647 Transcript_48349/m.89647 type:complete len:246 (-) Transcript_48349:266-1003(-)